MASSGFDEKKLKKNLDALIGGWIDTGKLPCAQAKVVRKGALAYEGAFGNANLNAKTPLGNDAIFRIYSMTKVFTCVAAMTLYEQGLFKMYDPLSEFIPEYKKTMVAEVDGPGHIRYVKPRREIVIRDLFTMASGIPYPDGDTPAERAMERLFRRCENEKKAGKPWDTVRFAREAAKNPLTAHPGEHWWYGMSIDILGALVCVLSGKTLSQFLKEKIFDPLGLHDTGFFVPAEKRDRFVTLYDVDAKGAFKENTDQIANYTEPNPVESGGGGLVSTADDVSLFAQMLLNFGILNGERILSRKSVELMRTNHLSDKQLTDYNWDTQRGYGYGLGVRVMMRPEIAGYGSVGEFAWDGAAGTWFSVDPAEEMTCVFLIQTFPGMHARFVPNFAQAVYGAIED